MGMLLNNGHITQGQIDEILSLPDDRMLLRLRDYSMHPVAFKEMFDSICVENLERIGFEKHATHFQETMIKELVLKVDDNFIHYWVEIDGKEKKTFSFHSGKKLTSIYFSSITDIKNFIKYFQKPE